MKGKLIIPILILLILHSCTFGERNENNLSEADLKFINQIIPLEEGENIQLFETNGGLKGFKTSGNFITNKRLASYWIDNNKKETYSVMYSHIDSLSFTDRIKDLTYASYIQVYASNNNDFKLYIDADSARTYAFFNKALENLKNKKIDNGLKIQ